MASPELPDKGDTRTDPVIDKGDGIKPLGAWGSGMTNTVVFSTEYAKVRWVAKKGIERTSRVKRIARVEHGAQSTLCERDYQGTHRPFLFCCLFFFRESDKRG